MSSSTPDDSEHGLDDPTRWASLHTLFAECLKEPTETFVEEVRTGKLYEELSQHETDLGFTLSVGEPPTPTDRGTLQEQYLLLFEAMEKPYAPPAESPYKQWYGDRDGGLLGGPSATDMEHRYEALDVSPPGGYPADHVALLLEYGALLLEAGHVEEYRGYLHEHFDWIPALEERVARANTEAQFYRWVVEAVAEIVEMLRARLDVPEPAEDTVETMVKRVDTKGERSEPVTGFHPSTRE